MNMPDITAGKVRTVVIDQIKVLPGRRGVTDAALDVLQMSVEETGGISDPILIRKARVGYELIDGAHRLAVARRMGGDEIAATVINCTQEQARFIERDRNLSVTHSLPLDLAVNIAQRNQAYQKLHPETARGVAGGLARQGQQMTEMSFAGIYAIIMGVTHRQVRRIAAAGAALEPDDIALLQERKAEIKMSDIYALAKVSDPAVRGVSIRAFAAGENKKLAAAIKMASPGVNAPDKPPAEVAFMALLSAWRRAPKSARKRFVNEHFKDLHPLIMLGEAGGADE